MKPSISVTRSGKRFEKFLQFMTYRCKAVEEAVTAPIIGIRAVFLMRTFESLIARATARRLLWQRKNVKWPSTFSRVAGLSSAKLSAEVRGRGRKGELKPPDASAQAAKSARILP